MLGERPAGGPLALQRFYRRCPRRGLLGGQLIFGRRRFQLFELQFNLFEQSRLALRMAAKQLAAQLLDLDLR